MKKIELLRVRIAKWFKILREQKKFLITNMKNSIFGNIYIFST